MKEQRAKTEANNRGGSDKREVTYKGKGKLERQRRDVRGYV